MGILKPVKKIILGVIEKSGYTVTKKKKIDDEWIHVSNPIEHNTKDHMNKFYSDDHTLDSYFDHERIEFYYVIVNLVKEKGIFSKGQTIADVGCGTGHLLQYLKKEFGFSKATGMDFSSEAIIVAKKKFPHFDFFEYDIYKKWDEKFDLIFCTEVLEHLMHPEEALANLVSMMNENGRLVITVPNGRIDTFGGHINFWSPESWTVFIKKNTQGMFSETGTIHNNSANYAVIKRT
jgi:2-polyprenyl-3-methyl-5-hydroxy-6-metoxy-1,4-benzoquinol methylase